MLDLPLGLVGRETGLGCMPDTCFSGWVCLFFCPCSGCMVVWVGVPMRSSYYPVSGGGLAYVTSNQVSLFP